MERSIGGQRVDLEIVGDGSAVLMLHGFTVDRRSLLRSVEPVFARRRVGYRRIHVDLPGFGASPRAPGIDSSAAMLDFVLQLVDDMIGADPFLIFGESWGAYLARGVIADRPEQVAGAALLVPVTIAPHADRTVPAHRVLYEEPGVLEGVPEADATEFREIGVVIDARSWSHYRSAVGPAIRVADAEAVAAIQAEYAFPTDVDAVGEPFARPTLIVAGRQDAVVGYRDALAILERFPQATFAVLDTAGHLLPGERPELLAALVNDWLDRVERPWS
jgi:pimeloyl-ACP methyl ester carboxylesterase